MEPIQGKASFTIAEFGRNFSISDDHVRRMIKKGLITAVDFSLKPRSKRKDLRILKSSIDEFIRARIRRSA